MRCIAEIADIGMTIDKKLRLTPESAGRIAGATGATAERRAAGCDPEKALR